MSARPFRKVLVANRGEIAVRILRTLREMGIPSVAVYSDADRGTLHARSADEAVRIGGAASAESYLNPAAILGAARRTGADAVHPGYGFLAENASFARACRDAGVAFIGPSPESMAALGDKASARKMAARAGVPVVPGAGDVVDPGAASAEAARIGYPVLLKASGGGGGRGMRLVTGPGEMREAFEGARREAGAAFGNPSLLLEKYVHPARHVEIQLLGDGREAVALGERECSLQRRHQKILEESPSPAVTPAIRAAMEEAATALARGARYAGAGTAEFLLGPDGSFYFLEVNARLQVEHPVTETRSSLDLVRAQVEIAAGGPLPGKPELRGHAIEVRLTAEDPYLGHLPQTGRVLVLRWPAGEGVRVDAGIREGQSVHAHYDSLLAKLIAHGRDREEARARLLQALRDLVVLGVVTNQTFLIGVLEDPAFVKGETYTHTVESRSWPEPAGIPVEVLLAAALTVASPLGARVAAGIGRDDTDRYSPWALLGPWGRDRLVPSAGRDAP